MIKPILSGLLAALLLVGGAAITKAISPDEHPEARSYIVSETPDVDVDDALEHAAENGKRVLLVMGANWCHDSRALAGWLGTDRCKALSEREYELVYVNVGRPQSGDGHNLSIAKRFGVEHLPGTPNLLVVTSEGELVNPDTATSWRNAASREEDAIYSELEQLARRPV